MTDPCECIDIFNHENAMRRLMNLLRDSQNACTDSGCDDLPNDPSLPDASGSYMMMMGWVVVATLLYLFRPGNLRRKRSDKPSPVSGDGSGGNPPPPPPAPPVH